MTAPDSIATSRPGASPRRGSFFETWRVFAGGWRPLAIVGVAVAGWLVFMPLVMGMNGRRALPPNVLMTLSMLPMATWFLERQLADRLAFMSLVPQPVETKWLVLAPMCALGLVTAMASGAFGKAPAISALALLGSTWWMIGSTRWLHRFGLWAFVAWIFVLLGPVASFAAYRVGGWGAAAAVAMVLGVGALLFQPGAYVGRALPRPGDTEEQPGARAPRSQQAASGDVRTSSLAAALRFFFVTSESTPGTVVLVCVMAAVCGTLPVTGYSLMTYLPGLTLLLPKLLGRAYAPATQEFLAAKPIDGRVRFIGGAVFPTLLILMGPVVSACLVNRELFDHGGAFGSILGGKPPRDDLVAYLREVLGATFLPQKWPAGGLPVELWVKLRPLLYLDILRAAFLILALGFALAPYVNSGRKERPPLNVTLALVTLAVVLRLGMTWKSSLPVPPLWFAALLAAIAIGDAWRRARVVLRPMRAVFGDPERNAP